MKKLIRLSNFVIIYSLATFVTIASLKGSTIFFGSTNYITKPFILLYEAMDAVKDGKWDEFKKQFQHPQKIIYNKELINNLNEDIFIAKVDLNNHLIVHNLRSDSTISKIDLNKLTSINVEEHNNPKLARYSSKIYGLTYENQDFALLIDISNEEVKKVLLPGISHHTTEFFNNKLLVMVRRKIPKLTALKNPVSKNENDFINDEGYVLINLNGEIIKTFWISSIIDTIKSNNRAHSLVHHTWSEYDPFHLNDVEIITSACRDIDSTSTFKIADVLISSRNMSSIFHLRDDNLINVITGKFNFQHDVDILSGDTISVFNNNSGGTYVGISNPSTCLTLLSPKHNYEQNVYENQGLMSVNQGKYTLVNNKYHVFENQNQNDYLIFQDSNLIFRGPFWLSQEDQLGLSPSWDVFFN